MRVNNNPVIAAGVNYSTNTSSAICINQDFYISAQAVVTGSGAAGTLKLQVSNDPVQSPQLSSPTNWSDISGASVAISGAGVILIPKTEICYNWARFVTSTTAAGVQTITTVADSAGSLNSKYFLISAGNLGVNYYVWMNVNSVGVDPMVAGKTGVEVDLATGATANDVADAVAAALDALAGFVAPNPAAAVITVTNADAGPFIPASDSIAAPTGFSFAVTAPTGTITVTPKTSGI